MVGCVVVCGGVLQAGYSMEGNIIQYYRNAKAVCTRNKKQQLIIAQTMQQPLRLLRAVEGRKMSNHCDI